HGIRACHLCPGDVDSDFLDQRPAVPDAAARAAMLTAEDVGRAVTVVLDRPPHVVIDELVISPAKPAGSEPGEGRASDGPENGEEPSERRAGNGEGPRPRAWHGRGPSRLRSRLGESNS